MHFHTATLAALLTTLTSLTAASPLSLSPRQDATASVYLCTDPNFTGTCENFTPPFDTCVNLSDQFNDTVSSVGPADGNFCRFFVDLGCSDTQAGVDFFDVVGVPGLPDLTQNGFDNEISSFQCSVYTGP